MYEDLLRTGMCQISGMSYSSTPGPLSESTLGPVLDPKPCACLSVKPEGMSHMDAQQRSQTGTFRKRSSQQRKKRSAPMLKVGEEASLRADVRRSDFPRTGLTHLIISGFSCPLSDE